jgi:pimeloyl-ACP methyl ester carboxylesterase
LIVDIGSARLHARVLGSGKPTVVFESGIGASSLSWWVVQPQVAGFATTLSYDRAGLGESPGSKGALTADRLVDDLHQLLRVNHLGPPFVLVGHSFGALLARLFASRYPKETGGLVLVDPVSVTAWANCSLDYQRRLALGVRLCRRGEWLARLGVVGGALAALSAGQRWVPQAAARLGGRKGASAVGRLAGEVRKLPPEVWPLVRAHWSRPKCFRALAEHLACLPEAAKTASKSSVRPDIPVVVLSADSATTAELEERENWTAEAGWGEHWRVAKAGHWLHLEEPSLVVKAITTVSELALKTKTPTG